jgi:gliding motility-associated protein GldL
MAILSKKVMGFLYGMGAAVVIVGALFKLMHWPGAGPMLVIGLLTEAAIFALSAFEPVEKDLDWSLVYPELAGGEPSAKKGKAENPTEAQAYKVRAKFSGVITFFLVNIWSTTFLCKR